jgi:hypothetical protein
LAPVSLMSREFSLIQIKSLQTRVFFSKLPGNPLYCEKFTPC